MKKIISVILSFVLLVSSLTAFAASFTDFDDSHWAASYVNELVAEGTINGFEDGSFRPAGTVTRAEFVKMIGKGPDRAPADFSDVPQSHWAYEYIMTSGLDAVQDNSFMPSQPITRGEVANLLWKRAGSPMGITAPPIINTQSDNRDAISWLYTNSIMTGDDNINLRLADTLTRAEAAALIVRSRKVNASTAKTNFYDAVSPEVLKIAYEAFAVVDKPYSESDTITNGELAMAAARLLSGHDKPDYPGVSATTSFKHQYAQPLNMLCRYYLGEENDNAEYIEKNATVKEAILALTFVTLRKSHSPITFDESGSTYALVSASTTPAEAFLKCAYQNGISLSADMTLDADKSITLKEFAALLLQFDGFSGFTTFDGTSAHSFSKDMKFNTNIGAYPATSADYRIIVAGVPNRVYEKSYVGAVKTPAETYDVTNPFDGIFNTMFTQLRASCAQKGISISILSSPTLSVETSNGYTFRVKLTVIEKGSAATLSDIVKCASADIGAKTLSNGEEIWLDINTGTPLNDIIISLDDVYVNQLI
ncbi:MAG: S-layer homology domain-containing protein [Clostridia bacterium]|nr:S-layer homology domain-containing protein [Clostridia bacterium]